MGRSGWPSSRMMIACGLLIMLVAYSGCAARKLSRVLMPTPIALTLGLPQPGGDLSIGCASAEELAPIFVVSGRDIRDPNNTLDPFGSDRQRIPALGIAYVGIGSGLSADELLEETTGEKRHKRAKVVFDRFELSKAGLAVDPWLVKDNVVRHRENPWVQAVKAQMEHSASRNVTIFVHGYNTEFIDNTLLAGEIFHYMGRKGVMISFEWPSESRVLGYIQDKGNATYSTRQFRAIISNIAKECEVDSITIIAHSAGSPIVVNALREIRLLEFDMPAEQVRSKYRIGRVVLAAPDMDVMSFTNAVHDRFYELTSGVAVYASQKDRALGLSEKIYGNSRLGRAVGKLDPWEQELLQKVPKIEMVDASRADKQYRNVLGHSYFHRDPWVSSDIGSFIIGQTPSQRGLDKDAAGVFWKFPRDYPDRLKRQIATGFNR
ncbi:alpha/beta hydrolase [Mariniblastus fucicola]|uniref:Alpha/beta hydrolase family protein n=1 Tax=Mariniblastus fucicola TaxID=980251 RepID=A0A5B9PB13_9BACT|nr:alpha/beta hydrolase [Mariniblastus fucicola]QEG22112.1 hypothetical protein MFFC18_19730 [Mariniblastus fucicola]